MRESGNESDEKKRARIRDGMPAENMRKQRREMTMYALRPVARREGRPRKVANRERIAGAILEEFGMVFVVDKDVESKQTQQPVQRANCTAFIRVNRTNSRFEKSKDVRKGNRSEVRDKMQEESSRGNC